MLLNSDDIAESKFNKSDTAFSRSYNPPTSPNNWTLKSGSLNKNKSTIVVYTLLVALLYLFEYYFVLSALFTHYIYIHMLLLPMGERLCFSPKASQSHYEHCILVNCIWEHISDYFF